jgi:hypothetical protein
LIVAALLYLANLITRKEFPFVFVLRYRGIHRFWKQQHDRSIPRPMKEEIKSTAKTPTPIEQLAI